MGLWLVTCGGGVDRALQARLATQWAASGQQSLCEGISLHLCMYYWMEAAVGKPQGGTGSPCCCEKGRRSEQKSDQKRILEDKCPLLPNFLSSGLSQSFHFSPSTLSCLCIDRRLLLPLYFLLTTVILLSSSPFPFSMCPSSPSSFLHSHVSSLSLSPSLLNFT